MNSLVAVREFFGTVLQQVCHFKVGVIAGDANDAAYKCCEKQERQDLYVRFLSCIHAKREMQREVNMGHPFERGFTLNIRPAIIRLFHESTDFDCCFLAMLSC